MSKYLSSTLGLHFFFVYRSMQATAVGSNNSNNNDEAANGGGEEIEGTGFIPLLPPQCIWSSFEFPLTTQEAQNRYVFFFEYV